MDIYPVNSENPVRVDFFGDTVERIRPYDAVTGERLTQLQTLCIVAATDVSFTAEDVARVKKVISEGLKE